jgi:carbamoyl-phosphate synthase large subunit
VNSNPATIMTDPEFADATYVEPLDLESLTRIIERERPDALLPTLGGQTALNLAIALDEPACSSSTRRAHRRERRGDQHRGEPSRVQGRDGADRLTVPEPGFAYSLDEAMAVADEVGYPLIVRPSFIPRRRRHRLRVRPRGDARVAAHGLATSPVSEILIEQSIAGWKEYELEVMRDHADNVVVICSIENFDAMGVHTGDSITVAPAQTLTDVEYQRLRDERSRASAASASTPVAPTSSSR